jgi:hypothetical protein
MATVALLACAHDPGREGVANNVGAAASRMPPSTPAATSGAQANNVADAETDATPDVPASPGRWTTLGTFGVEILAPHGARVQPEKNERIDVYLSSSCPSAKGDEMAPDFCEGAVFERAHGPAPSTLADALALWDPSSYGDGVTLLGDGVSPTGASFALYTFQVPVGFRKGTANVHTFKWVSRSFAALAIDAASHVTCTGYVEHKSAANDADLLAVCDLCTSMRIRP